jgi:hypothetical protein
VAQNFALTPLSIYKKKNYFKTTTKKYPSSSFMRWRRWFKTQEKTCKSSSAFSKPNLSSLLFSFGLAAAAAAAFAFAAAFFGGRFFSSSSESSSVSEDSPPPALLLDFCGGGGALPALVVGCRWTLGLMVLLLLLTAAVVGAAADFPSFAFLTLLRRRSSSESSLQDFLVSIMMLRNRIFPYCFFCYIYDYLRLYYSDQKFIQMPISKLKFLC